MAGPTATARADLAATLEACWPGRVYPYVPNTPRPVAGIYIGELAASWDTDDVGSPIWAATFAVHLVADGADRAAAAMLDDLVDQVYRAAARSDLFYPDAVTWAPWQADQVVELPAYTFTVRTVIDVVTWCAVDEAVAVTIPPAPIGV